MVISLHRMDKGAAGGHFCPSIVTLVVELYFSDDDVVVVAATIRVITAPLSVVLVPKPLPELVGHNLIKLIFVYRTPPCRVFLAILE